MADDITSGNTRPEPEECVKPQAITDKFKIMMRRAHKAQKIVLLKRADDLLSWGVSEENDFLNVFSFKGKDIIKVRKKGEDTGRRMQARIFMVDGVRRIMKISNGMTMDNFKNYTKCNEFAAYIEPNLDPPYIVNIGKNFESRGGKKNPVTGEDSHVSTLCHEMSHIFWYWKNNDDGGMWTQDYTAIDRFATSMEDEISYTKHIKLANNLVKLHKDQLFENAYNIEKYFYIKLSDSEIDSADEHELSNKVSSKILDLEKLQKTSV